MKPVIKYHYNGSSAKFELNNLPDKTVPDQSMTIREIINRSQKGLPITGVRVPMYNETEEGVMPDLRNMDLSEVAELKRRMQQAEKRIKKDLQEQEEQQKRMETEEYYRKKFKKTDQVVDLTDSSATGKE